MLITAQIIAKKYALAFLGSCQQDLSQTLLEHIEQFGNFLGKHKVVTTHLSIPILSETTTNTVIKELVDHFSLNAIFEKMLFLLVEHKRITLLPLIINHILNEYNKRHSIGIFTVSSSHPLQEQQKERIIKFITNTVPYKKIRTTFTINPNLISGIRIQSDTLLWEKSINRFLQRAEQCTFQRAGL